MSAPIKTELLTLVVESGGSVTGYTGVVRGAVKEILYVHTDYDAGADFTITTENTGQQLWMQNNGGGSTKSKKPMQPTHSVAGVAATYDGVRAVNDLVHVCNERIKVVVSSATEGQTGTFEFIIE